MRFTPLPLEFYAHADEPGSVLLETARFDDENLRSYLFRRPVRSLVIRSSTEVPALFAALEDCLRERLFLAGYFSYECGYHFEDFAPACASDHVLPLAWFGAYEAPVVFDHRSDACMAATAVPSRPFSLRDCALATGEREYSRAVAAVRDYIAAGDVYQVNYTSSVGFEFDDSPLAVYLDLKRKQKVPYSALLNVGGHCILSFSPELFFRREHNRIVVRPMKGTVRRGRYPAEDRQLAAWLRADEKNRSENLMIVDLLRNDLGRIARTGSVHVDRMFDVEQYETLLQMTSTISAHLRDGLTWYEIFRALFPSGSVTGAPKIRAMQIIRELEPAPRGVYTGAIGFITPGREAVFNVAIRTVLLEGKRGAMGTGSGIVYDSSAPEEYAECRLKTEFLVQPAEQPFHLLESMLWDGGCALLPCHLERLRESAAYFGFRFDESRTRKALAHHCGRLCPGGAYKIRLLLAESGEVAIESAPLENAAVPSRVALSPVPVRSEDRFLYHKTTRRELYDRWSEWARLRGFVDVIFRNERREITEGAISNVFVARAYELYTPPVACGLLPGVYRRHVLETNAAAREKVIFADDLRSADAIYICNAVRGWQQVELVELTGGVECSGRLF